MKDYLNQTWPYYLCLQEPFLKLFLSTFDLINLAIQGLFFVKIKTSFSKRFLFTDWPASLKIILLTSCSVWDHHMNYLVKYFLFLCTLLQLRSIQYLQPVGTIFRWFSYLSASPCLCSLLLIGLLELQSFPFECWSIILRLSLLFYHLF
jgi:hypothetical protein